MASMLIGSDFFCFIGFSAPDHFWELFLALTDFGILRQNCFHDGADASSSMYF